jgi:hypothetical protein
VAQLLELVRQRRGGDGERSLHLPHSHLAAGPREQQKRFEAAFVGERLERFDARFEPLPLAGIDVPPRAGHHSYDAVSLLFHVGWHPVRQ